MTIPIRTENLSKVYRLPSGRVKKALNSLNIEVPEGVIFGFLGPNGAGKTTTIKILLDFLHPTHGSATIFGLPSSEPDARKLVGYLPEQPYFHKFIKPIELLVAHAVLAGIPRSQAHRAAVKSLEMVEIMEYASIPISKLSKGLTQRVGIAQALVGDPMLLILDEPTSGLDPIGRRHTRDLLLKLKEEGRTVFLSSHLLSELENLCDIVAIIRDGTLVAYGAPEQIRSSSTYIRIQTSPISSEIQHGLQFLGVQIERSSDCTTFRVDPKAAYEVFRALEALNLPLINVETERESLEEAFLRLAA
ncbi:MAG: ABC transporter ATP-binding protein [Armatimonadota bacterium]